MKSRLGKFYHKDLRRRLCLRMKAAIDKKGKSAFEKGANNL